MNTDNQVKAKLVTRIYADDVLVAETEHLPTWRGVLAVANDEDAKAKAAPNSAAEAPTDD